MSLQENAIARHRSAHNQTSHWKAKYQKMRTRYYLRKLEDDAREKRIQKEFLQMENESGRAHEQLLLEQAENRVLRKLIENEECKVTFLENQLVRVAAGFVGFKYTDPRGIEFIRSTEIETIDVLTDAARILEKASEKRVCFGSLNQVQHHLPKPDYLPLFFVEPFNYESETEKLNDKYKELSKIDDLEDNEHLIPYRWKNGEWVKFEDNLENDQQIYLIYRKPDGRTIRKICWKIVKTELFTEDIPEIDFPILFDILPPSIEVFFNIDLHKTGTYEKYSIQIEAQQRFNFVPSSELSVEVLKRYSRRVHPVHIEFKHKNPSTIRAFKVIEFNLLVPDTNISFEVEFYILPTRRENRGGHKITLGEDFLDRYVRGVAPPRRMILQTVSKQVVSTNFWTMYSNI